MTYPYGTKGAPAVGNGLGGLPRRAVASAASAAGQWRAVGAPATVSESNYKGGYRSSIAVDRSTNRVMLMENNASGTALSATIYQISNSGILTLATGSTTNTEWTAICNSTENGTRRGVVGAQGTFFSPRLGYRATISGASISFGTTAISVPSSTPKSTGGTIGSSPGVVAGTIAASIDGRVFCYTAGAVAPIIEVDVSTGVAILASNNAPNASSQYNGAVISNGRYIAIFDADGTTMRSAVATLDLLTHVQTDHAKSGITGVAPTNSNAWRFIIDPIDANAVEFNSAYGYSAVEYGGPYDTINMPTLVGAKYFASSSAYVPLGEFKWGTRETRYAYGDMLFEYSSSSLGFGLQERRFLGGQLPSQRSASNSTDPTVAFFVGQNLSIVITGTSMQAYAR